MHHLYAHIIFFSSPSENVRYFTTAAASTRRYFLVVEDMNAGSETRTNFTLIHPFSQGKCYL